MPLRQQLTKRIRQFFANRTPKSDEVSLNLRNVYIFFSREGILFALLLLITFIAGINYGNNLVLGLCFYLASIWLITVHLTFSHVSSLKFKLLNVSMPQAGKPAWITVQITNTSKQPSRQIRLRFDHTNFLEEQHLKKNSLPSSAIAINLTSIQGDVVVKLPVLTQKRGQFELPRLIVNSIYPLGVMRAWSYIYFASPVWVYPKPSQFEWDMKQAFAGNDDSSYSQYQTDGQDDFDRLDEYQQGESLSRVSWSHVARGHGMLTKHFSDSVGRELTLDYNEMPASHHEQKLEQLTYAIQRLEAAGEAFSLNLPNDVGEFGQGSDFVNSNLLRLARCS